MMGYADPDQVGSGLRQRLYSRAFIIGNPNTPEDRLVYLVLDTQSGDTAVRHGILEGLSALGEDFSLYGERNIAVTGTHSHSGPGAWLNYLLPQITSKGFNKQSYQAIVDGAILSIRKAHESITPGFLTFGSTEVKDANINRSPYAYLANPKKERSKYSHDVDKTMTLLKFERASDGKAMGVLTWFPVHGTSMLGNNTLISGDNKGVAAHLFEQSVKDDLHAADDFVAGFSQSNVGDTSPNVLGAYCEDGSGSKCNFKDSTCGGKTQPCHGRGPFFREDDQGSKSCFEIGRRQFLAAKTIFDDIASAHGTEIRGPTVTALHTYHDFSHFTFTSPLTGVSNLSTCPAALGHSFAAGTTDGPGAFDFTQGTNNTDPDQNPSTSNPLWRIARAFVHPPTEAQIACHTPKPILLDVGAVSNPYAWTPNIVNIQLLRVGQLIIIVSPGEATTMSGRRWKAAIADKSVSTLSIPEPIVVIGGPANTYAHYIATEEEYGVQRYEGASTLYGPHTLAAYINLTLTYLPHLNDPAPQTPLPKGPEPPINTNASLSFIRPVIMDRTPFFKSFGDVLESPSQRQVYKPRQTVRTRFVGANPRNSLRLEGTFAAIEKRVYSRSRSESTWVTVHDDRDWNVVFRWERTSTVLGTSEVTIEWEIEDDVEDHYNTGVYRMHYYGDAKSIGGSIEAFEGIGEDFRVMHVDKELLV